MSDFCRILHQRCAKIFRYKFPFDKEAIPANGIYILFEKGEYGHGGDRIVRIGTHRGSGNLGSRLKEHFITKNKDRSVFRENIGSAILNRDGDSFLRQWLIDLTSREAREKYSPSIDRLKLADTEKRVSEYIQEFFKFVVIEVADKTKRIDFESKLISTISLCTECYPSKTWLGHYSPKPKIRESGLWQESQLYKTPLNNSELSILFDSSV